MSDDSDDDIPIALLLKRQQEEKAKKAGAGDSLKSSEKKRSSSDDAPKKKPKLSTEHKPEKKEVTKIAEKKVSVEKKPVVVAKEKKPTTTSNGSTPKIEKKEKRESDKKDKKTVVRDVGEENIFGLERLDKHNLVSAVLRRWKYCLDSWPGQLPPEPPHGYIEAHVPGLYVGVSNIHLGQLKDLRPFVDGKTPSMASLLTYKTVHLQQLLIKGIKAQLALLGASPEDEKLKSKLRHELEKAEKLKVKKYERKYREALKAIGKPEPVYNDLIKTSTTEAAEDDNDE